MYVRNELGDIKCLTEDGTTRWLGDNLVNDSLLMRTLNLTPVKAPVKLEPIVLERTILNEDNVAEAVVAVKQRKQKTK